MDTDLLKTFIVAAQRQNFRETAEQLMMTQPAVTKQIRKLEALLNLQLFDRVQQRIHLNANGHYFLPRAQKMVQLENEITEQLRAFQIGYTEKVTLGVAPQIANSTLPLIVKKFNKLHPDIKIEIEILPSNEIGEAVFRQYIDIGISKVPSTRELISIIIANEPVMLVAARPFDKGNYDVLIKTSPIYTHSFSPYWEKVEQHLPKECKIERLNQTEVIKNFIKQGMGIAFLPKSVVRTEVQRGELFAQVPPIQGEIQSATYMHTKYTCALFEQFTDICIEIYSLG
ncbi:LysR family transcriptional regulator [Solibacillus sp. CAU 1738]|uniref:LysR family transcriptional regulator n=1 Tax=Solibacillus sp. CAU 1738 TaxID=3140363 RepID=UPI003261A7C4